MGNGAFFQSVRSRLIFWVAMTCGVVFAAAIVYSFYVSRRLVLDDASRDALAAAEADARQIEEDLRSVEEGTKVLASALENTTISRAEMESLIRAFVAGDTRVYGTAAAFAPEDGGPYSPYIHRRGDDIVRVDLANAAYRYWEVDWYTSAANSGRPGWTEPYWDDDGGNIVIVTYFVPVFSPPDATGSRKIHAVVSTDVSLDWLRGVVESPAIRHSGYALVLSRRGHVLAHPDPSLIVTDKTALDLAQPKSDPKAREIVEKMLRGEEGFAPYDDLYLGARARAAFRPIGGAGWSFAVVYREDELLGDVQRLARIQLGILGGGIVALVLVVAAVSQRLTRPLRELSRSAERIATGDLELEIPTVESRDELGALTRAFRDMRDSLKVYIHDLEQTTKAKGRLESELQIARTIQMDMLPAASAGGGVLGYELSAALVPARQVGGDLYDHFMLDGRLCFVVGDVSGKGVAAALFMARAKTIFEAVASHESDLAEVLREVNRNLCAHNEQRMFVTLFAGTLDLRSGRLLFASAGHDAPVVVPACDGPPRFLEVSGGPVLGLLDAADYQEQETTLSKGEALVVYTDGVPEALDANGNFFTVDRLLKTVEGLPGSSTNQLAQGVLAAVKAFSGDAPQSDDITVMAVRYTKTGQ